MTRIRTLEFLPEIFQTPTNSQFLSATLDQLVNPPVTQKIQGYVGSKFGYGINAKDFYVTEPDKTRTDYQLDPGVIFTKPNESTALDFLTYPGLIDALKQQDAPFKNNSRLFESQFYSWDSFANLDKIINYNEYYWLPEGPPAVEVATDPVFITDTFTVINNPNSYDIRTIVEGSENPIITLIRGGSYEFVVNQTSQFWIQGVPGLSGINPVPPFINTRDVFGVSNNGASQGIITFDVPQKDAQDEYNFPGNNLADVISTIPFGSLNGALANTINLDGVTSLNGLRVLFYNTGIDNEIGYVQNFYDETNYDQNNNLVQPIIIPIQQSTHWEIGYDEEVNAGGLIIGQEYVIVSVGTTDFTLVGAASNTPGLSFVATGPGSGTGVAAVGYSSDLYGENINYLTVASGYDTTELIVNQTVTFNSPTIGGVIPGQVYFIYSILDDYSFTITETLGGDPIVLTSQTGNMIANVNQGLYEEGYYTQVNANFYRITYVGSPGNYVIKLIDDGLIPTKQKITITYGNQYIARNFFRNDLGFINIIPYISAPLDTFYYQDGTNPNKVGVIKIIENEFTNTIDVDNDILGQQNYTAPNGVVFTNGLKVIFDGDVVPVSYLQGEYYVEGVGSSISLVPAIKLSVPEPFSSSIFVPFDTAPFDIGNFDGNLFIPVTPDYITIARNALNLNAWSRSNRWFHIDVISATANYNNNSAILTTYATYENKAKRPIIEFYPNLKLFDTGTLSRSPIDFLDFRTTNAFTEVAGQTSYYPDVAAYTNNTVSIAAQVSPNTITTLTVDIDDVNGVLAVGQYIQDSLGVLPTNTTIKSIEEGNIQYTITVEWEDATTIPATTNVNFITGSATINSYNVFPGAKILFANDNDINVRTKVYEVQFSQVTPFTTPVISLVETVDNNLQFNDHIVVLRGYNNEGLSFYYDDVTWVSAQQKITVNQPPLFDLFNENGVSFSNSESYRGTSFVGNKLFSYGIGAGLDDSILGFPIRYSNVDNVGDISFDVNLNIDTFTYVNNTDPITEKVNKGYVHNYTSRTEYVRELGWQTAVGPSTQYQLFQFDYIANNPTNFFVCDIPVINSSESNWPTVQVYVNNIWQNQNKYFVTTTDTTTTINLSIAEPVDTVVQVLLLSNQTSSNAYYTIPINLSNNPFNQDIETANIGDIRNHYRSIFINNRNMQGEIFGKNNYRDLGNVVPYGTAIIQNSAANVLPSVFLRKQAQNLFDAILFNSREYINYKQLIVDTVNNLNISQTFTPADVLDSALEVLTKSKTNSQAFFWSDMIPSKSSYITNNYNFKNNFAVSVYPLSKIYNFQSANYNGILVYLSRIIQGVVVQKQLLKDIDYVVSETEPTLTLTISLQTDDVITIKEFNQTYGSYAPNTPTKLGLYPSFIPEIVLDSTYISPTYFIKGHDGSYTKLYGDYDATLDTLIDFRDQAIFEYEKRVYNNLKISTEIPIQPNSVLPGYFRTTDLSYNEFLDVYAPNFLNWVGQNRLDYKTQYFITNNEFTYNYSNSGNKIDQEPIQQGAWRGVYQYFYDTSEPNYYPWEMLGLSVKPSWWESRYGPAPYTSENEILWGDLEQGINWNNGNPYVIPEAVRPGLSQVIPVDSMGKLLSPFASVVGNYDRFLWQRNWKVGDVSPVEFAYRRSSTWPFDLMKILAVTKPSQFFNLGVDLDNYKYNTEFNQYLINDRSHLILNQIQIYGNGIAKTSYLNWIVDYEKQLGINGTEKLTSTLNNLDVRLVYRLAGFSDKKLLKFYVEKGSPNSTNASLLIPDESFSVLLYDNQPYSKLTFSGVVIQKLESGYTVYGNSIETAYFKTLVPVYDGFYDYITVDDLNVQVTDNYSTEEVIVPYGTVFYTPQEVSQFLASYGAYLISEGMVFNTMEFGVEVDWRQMIGEYLYWAQTGWENGSIITLNPAANELRVDKPNSIVQPLTLQNTNFILNQNLYPISTSNLSIIRDGTAFVCTALNNGDSLAYSQFNFSNFEHGIVFDNITTFDDILYNLTTSLRQNRITVRGVKSAEWNGTVNASGFILNQDNILEWDRQSYYTKGVIVKYKNKFWTSLRKVQPSPTFNESEWKETEYDEIQKGLLPNSSTRSYESTLYYNVNETNLEQDANVLGFSLIGYRPRDYLSLVDLTDITQVNVYKNLIKNKGTKNSLSAFKGANLPQGGIDYEVYENWAIKTGDFGGVLNDNFVEFRLSENLLTGNPSIASLTNGVYTVGSQQEVPLYSLFNYGIPVDSTDILPLLPTYTPIKTFPTAGYVNFNDVKMSAYFYSFLPNAVDKAGVIVPIENFYVRNYVWLANYLQNWEVFSWYSIGEIVAVIPNLNNTCTVRFTQPHNLSRLEPLAIINFYPTVNGYYTVLEVVDLYDVVISLALGDSAAILTGQGIGLGFQSQRVDTPSDIINLPLLNAEFVKNTVWVDNDIDGDWAVYRKSINYKYLTNLVPAQGNSYGTAVAYTSKSGYLISDPNYTVSEGRVYDYAYNPLTDTYGIIQTFTGDESFGQCIAHSQQTYVISQPYSTPSIFIYNINNSIISDRLIFSQEIPAPSGSITSWGACVDISGDTNWLYISDLDNDIGNYRQKIYVYKKQNIPLLAGYFVIGETYQITSVGTTDFTLLGAISNEEGIIFYCDDGSSSPGTLVGTGTGTATQISYKFVDIIDGSSYGEDFGKSLATDYNGDTLIVGAPGKDYNATIQNWGSAHLYQRTVQNIEVQTNFAQGVVAQFQLGWTPTTVSTPASIFSGTTITLGSTASLNNNDPIVFTGVGLSGTGVSAYQTYYVMDKNVGGANTIKIKTTRNTTTPVTLGAITSGTVTAIAQTSSLYIMVNGTVITDNNYNVVGDVLYYNGGLLAGDIINVSGNQFTLIDTLTSQYNPRVGVQFGNSVDITRTSSEIIIGSPFELNDSNVEGAVYRYTNIGARFGNILGTGECNVLTTRNLFINGFLVKIPVGNASVVANAINVTGIPNVTANYTTSNNLYISVIDTNLAIVNEKLLISVTDATLLDELGLSIYTQTQVINDVHGDGSTQFGYTVKFNESDSFVASSPIGSRYETTTFDFTDDENLDNDTIFDNNATQFIDSYPNAGAVYMFDYLPPFNGSATNPGNYVFAQSLNSIQQLYGAEPLYGKSLDFYDNNVLIGSPNFNDGEVVIYNNDVGLKDWAIYRKSSQVVNIEKIENVQIFSAQTNNTLVNLDYFDPLQGKLLGAIQQNLDFVANNDPARYNNQNVDNIGVYWGSSYVGRIWFDTTNVRFVNYHQNDVVYNSEYWGELFPGSDVAVYTWIESNVTPDLYTGPGTVFDPTLYSIEIVLDSSNTLVPVYYYWVRNTGIIDKKIGKTLSDSILSRYIENPIASGISYFAPLLSNCFGFYNVGLFLNGIDSVFHIGYSVGQSSDVSHSEFTLIRANFPDDFLPGLPPVNTNDLPSSLYDRMLDSMAGVDEAGQVVPNPFLPRAVQSGIQVRPRQSFFYDRLLALKNYFIYANTILKQFPIVETRQAAFPYLLAKNPANSQFAEGEEYNTANYWEYINWWATGYDDNTKSAFTVQYYADLSTLEVDAGTIVTVGLNATGNQETYIYTSEGTWDRIGLENGTIQLKESLYNYSAAKLGFGDNFFDTNQYDQYPSTETRYIVRALNEQIYIDELVIFRNKSLILLFEYIQTETTQSQNFLPWLSKTSLIDVSHTIRELIPLEVFQTDNQDFLSGYLNEVKPYHVVIKDFLFKYTGTDVFEGDITDFDLPSQYDSSVEKFITPQLVYTTPTNYYEYLPTDSIWETRPYNQWFLNKGLSIGTQLTVDGEIFSVGQPSYLTTNLLAYVNMASSVIFLENASGLPINGVVKIGEEYIGYSYVDRALNLIGNLSRGLFESEILDHIPGDPVIIDLPPVIVIDGGRGYTSTPKITAYLDPDVYPLPSREAQFEAIMSLDRVTAINVIDPGQGYMATPEIVIDPAATFTFSSNNVNSNLDIITFYIPGFVTGDMVQYKVVEGSVSVGGLVNNNWYYINLLQSNPNYVIALYTTYGDALNDNDRVNLYNGGSGSFKLLLGARAYAVTTAQPIRENTITLRYDRTSYRSQVIDWVSGAYYGGFFAGRYSNSERVASSSITLQNTKPAISTILASAQGVAFEVEDVVNEQTIEFSSFVRQVYEILGNDDIIRLKPLDGNGDPFNYEPNASGLTLGFYSGMPIKFNGDVGGGIVGDTIYYVKTVLNPTDFTISATPSGSIFSLSTFTSVGVMSCYVGEVTNQAIVTINYPGILTVTATSEITNKITVPLTKIGTGGTSGFYTGLPLEFVGNVFGNIIANEIYYVTSVADKQTFTIGKTANPIQTNVSQTNSSTDTITVENSSNFRVNDPVIINDIIFASGQLLVGQTYEINELNGTDFTALGATENIKGLVFVATETGSFLAEDFVAGYLYTITLLGDTDWNLLANTDGVTYVIGDTILALNPTSATGTTGTGVQGSGTVKATTFGNINAGQTYWVQSKPNVTSIKLSTEINGSAIALVDQEGVAVVTNQRDTLPLSTATGSMTLNVGLPVSPGQINGQEFTFYDTSTQITDPVIGPNENLIVKTVGATLGDGTTSGENKLAIRSSFTGLSNFYVNMPIEVSTDIGEAEFEGRVFAGAFDDVLEVTDVFSGKIYIGSQVELGSPLVTAVIVSQISNTNVDGDPNLEGTYQLDVSITGGSPLATYTIQPTIESSTVYRVIEYTGRYNPETETRTPKLQANCTTTSSSGNVIICDSTSQLYEGMPVVFSGQGLGRIIIGQEYWVKSIVSTTQFTISEVLDGITFTLENDNGTMICNGEQYIQVANPLVNYDPIILSSVVEEFSITQTPQSPPSFDVSWILGGYRVLITDPGSGYAVNNTITINGERLNGVTPTNNLTLTVNTVDNTGAIASVICNGTVPGNSDDYYLRVISPTQLEVFSNSLMNIPVNGNTLPYVGIKSTTVTQVKASGTGGWTADPVVVCSSVSDFDIEDTVIFTGNVFGNIVLAEPYYVIDKDIATNELVISSIPSGTAFDVGVATGSMTMAKPGSFILLPEPFYFNQSIVRYNNRAYICVVSNNDSEFIFGKWDELNSGDRRLNALDRVISYYQPTLDMPGVDLNQLFTGLSYPNSTYLGNPFAPAQQYPLDTILQDIPFYTTGVDVASVLYDGEKYLAPANIPNDYSAVLISENGTDWNITKLSNFNIETTDIVKGEYYVISSRNTATPIFRSNDGINWTTNGYYTPYGSTPYDDTTFDMTALNIAAISLNSVAHNNGMYVAVGSEIVTSTDTYIWRSTFSFPIVTWNNAPLTHELYGVSYVSLPAFTGYVAVGKGQRFDYSTGLTQTVPTNIILTSQNGTTWVEIPYVSNLGFYGVTSDSEKIVVVGEYGVTYYSENGTNWFGINQTNVISALVSDNIINVGSTIGLIVNDVITFNQGFGSVLANTEYYVHSIIGSTQIKISATLGGSIYALTTTTVPENTYLRKLPITEDLNDITYINNMFMAVGNNGLIRTSVDGISWTTQSSGTTRDLYGITFKPENLSTTPVEPNTWTVVGKDNTIIQSYDDGVSWTATNIFAPQSTVYDVKGDAFDQGYGPEELVPGDVKDGLMMTVTTRPGTSWPAYEYGHVGYNVVSLELTPTSGTQVIYSFDRAVQFPATVAVFEIDGTTMFSTSLYEDSYTIDWINNLIILNSPLPFVPIKNKLRIDVTEVGNGDQLVKSSTKSDPIITNDTTGFQEIFLNCNYSDYIFNGSGIIRPDQLVVDTAATSTQSIDDSITVDDVGSFVVNGVIYFSGEVFGNVAEDTPYYVKSVNIADRSITISDSYNFVTGIAGPIFALSDATGLMRIVISSGTTAVWTDPQVLHNGEKMVLGVIGNVTRTKSSNNGITTNTTAGMVVGTKIKFSSTMFGIVTPLTTYYVASIIDNNEFTISLTQGGPILTLTDASGGATFVTNDFAFGPTPDNENALMIFSDEYDNDVDYIVYSIFGETSPIQYGYTVPEIQLFNGDGSTFIFTLNNYVGGLNPNNAIVELNGLRLTNSQYTISGTGNTLTLVNPPLVGDVVAVRSFSSTDRQYLNTQFNITGETGQFSSTITVGATVHTEVSFDETGTGFDSQVLSVGYLILGRDYSIATLGTTTQAQWNIIAGTSSVVYNVGDTLICANDGDGFGNGTVIGPGYFDENLDYLECAVGSSTDDLFVNAPLTFLEPVLDGINPAIIYYVTEIWNSRQFVISTVVAGSPYVLTDDTGAMVGSFNSLTVADITNIDNEITLPRAVTTGLSTIQTSVIAFANVDITNDDLTITSPSGTVELGMVLKGTGILPNTVIVSGSGTTFKVNKNQTISGVVDATATGYWVEPDLVSGFVDGLTIMFKSAYYDTTELILNNVYQIFDLGSTSQSVWNTLAGTSGVTYEVGDTFTRSNTGSGAGTGVCLLADFGGLNTLGQVYFITYYRPGVVVVEDQYGNVIEVDNSSPINTPAVRIVVGGLPAVRVTTQQAHNFDTNDFVRIDGVKGSVQLNNNTYFVHVITNNVVDLYFTPYLFAATATNNPVEGINTYLGGGYIWLDNLFTVADTFTFSTSSDTNRIYVYSTSNFIQGTPVYFAQVGFTIGETIIGGIVCGEDYYVGEVFEQQLTNASDFKLYATYIIQTLGVTDWNLVAGTSGVSYSTGDYVTAIVIPSVISGEGTAYTTPSFTITTTRFGTEVIVTNDKESATVTQWQQDNVDRLWVTLNGYRVPSSKLRINANNNLTILATIDQGDQVIVTSMIPTATPNEEVYLLNVDQSNEPDVIRTNMYTRTWVTQPVYPLVDTIYVDDVRRVTTTFTQEEITPVAVDGRYSFGLIADKTMIAQITVYNNTKAILLNPQTYYVEIEKLSPELRIITGSFISPGDELTITTLQGNLLYVNGEQIGFTTVNFENNTISGLLRGANGTGIQPIIPKYVEVFGILSENIMSMTSYDETWNSDIYNLTDGDPLQISVTTPAEFLRSIP